MYAAPEQTLSLAGPGKFDVFSAAMTGVRVLLPSLTKSSATKEWPGGRFQQFAELEFPGTGYDFKVWLQQRALDPDRKDPKLAAECKDMLENPVHAKLLALLQKMLSKSIRTRPSVQQALEEVRLLLLFVVLYMSSSRWCANQRVSEHVFANLHATLHACLYS
jgi:hypothetical protein